MTPLHLEILIHHHVCPNPFPRDTETIRDYRVQLLRLGLLEPAAESMCFETTDKGKAWLEKVLNTPLPTQKWVWEP